MNNRLVGQTDMLAEPGQRDIFAFKATLAYCKQRP